MPTILLTLFSDVRNIISVGLGIALIILFVAFKFEKVENESLKATNLAIGQQLNTQNAAYKKLQADGLKRQTKDATKIKEATDNFKFEKKQVDNYLGMDTSLGCEDATVKTIQIIGKLKHD